MNSAPVVCMLVLQCLKKESATLKNYCYYNYNNNYYYYYWASAGYATHNNEILIDEVKNIIMKSPSKCCSLDPVPTYFLKLCVCELIYLITAIANVY